MKSARLRRLSLHVAVVLSLTMVPTAEAARRHRRPRLPETAMRALKTAFPGAFLEGVGRAEEEDETGVTYWVEMEHKGSGMEVRITPEGVLVEVGKEIDKRDAPKAVLDAISGNAKGARILGLHQTEVRALGRHGRFHELEKPLVLFHTELARENMAAEMTVTVDGSVIEKPRWRPRRGYESISSLPAKAGEAVKQRYPDARIVEVDMEEEEEGLPIYIVRLSQAGREMSVHVSADGQIARAEGPASPQDIPKPVEAAIRKLSTGGAVRGVRIVEVFALHEFRQLLRLKKPFKLYVARFARGDAVMEATIVEDGKVIEKPRRTEEEDEDE